MGWWSPVPVYIDGCPCRDPHIIVLDYTRRIDQIQLTMDKSGFGTSMLAYDSVRGHWANTSLIQSPRGHTTGSGNAQHYMLACVLLIIDGRNCVGNLVNIYNLCISTHTQFYITLSRCVLVIKVVTQVSPARFLLSS